MKYKNISVTIKRTETELKKLQETGTNYNRQLILGDKLKNLKAMKEEIEHRVEASFENDLARSIYGRKI